jgi:hypothetical protein
MVEVDSFPHYMSSFYSCGYPYYIISPSSCITRNQLHDCFMSESKSMWHIFRGTFRVRVIQNSFRYIMVWSGWEVVQCCDGKTIVR